MKSVPF